MSAPDTQTAPAGHQTPPEDAFPDDGSMYKRWLAEQGKATAIENGTVSDGVHENAPDDPPPAAAPEPDMDVVLPDLGEPIRVAGCACDVNRVKFRELMTIMRILSDDLGPTLARIQVAQTQEDFGLQIGAMLFTAAPTHVEDLVALFMGIVVPKQKYDADTVYTSLRNPELDETMDIIFRIANQEAAEIQRLVGKAQEAFKMTQALYRKGQRT